MARTPAPRPTPAARFPHPRGDGPDGGRAADGASRISPPAWGWPAVPVGPLFRLDDFPTRVGMARPRPESSCLSRRFPHPRGDGPQTRNKSKTTARISPPAWGWPGQQAPDRAADGDFPTRVGMARSLPRLKPIPRRFPHPRGDGPRAYGAFAGELAISPPAWGWPGAGENTCRRREDFPTRVGMARSKRRRRSWRR